MPSMVVISSFGMHHGEREAGVHAAAVDVNGTGAALAVVAAFLGAGQIQVLAEAVEESSAGIDSELVLVTVDLEGQGYGSFDRRRPVLCGRSRGRRRRGEEGWSSGGQAGGSQVRQEGSSADASEEWLAGLGSLS